MQQLKITFLLDELITCGAVLSTYELTEALRELGVDANICSPHNNAELEKYFNIEPIREPRGVTITVTPKRVGDYAYVRTKDGRWLNHTEPIIAVSQWIADWIGGTVIGNGTHKRFKDLNIERDIDVLIEGNYEKTKNIDGTIDEARARGEKIVWFGRQTVPRSGVENISHPAIQDIPILYNRAKVFLKKSKEEGWGRPIAEAMACGVPRIINLSGGNQDIQLVKWKDIAQQLLNYVITQKRSQKRIKERD